MPETVFEIALEYLGCGWKPVPIHSRSKKPVHDGWPDMEVTPENIPTLFNNERMNIGVQLGLKSQGLTDVDLDCPEAVRLAPYFLPSTGAVFGRENKPRSHYLYRIMDAPDRATVKVPDAERRCIIELRTGGGSKGAQTVFPGSIHESGEAIEWAVKGEPAASTFTVLNSAIRKIAAAVILLRAYPAHGSRHDHALALGGSLARAGWDTEDIRPFVEVVASEGGSNDPSARAHDAISAATGVASGDVNVYGLPKLKEIIGDASARAVANILGLGRDNIEGVTLDDFQAYMPAHNYIFTPSREPWPASSVNARIPPIQIGTKPNGEPDLIKANMWLDRNKPVEQMTWAPGLPPLIADRLISDGGWIGRPGVTCFNLYKPPTIPPGNPADAGRWLDHAYKVYPLDAEHLVKWLAQRVQQPQEKINHAIVLGGAQGIGKDTFLDPVKHAVGPWNFTEVSPQQILGRFNGFLKSVVLRVSEARDLGEINRFQFYEHMKTYTAAPPDVLRVDEKNLREHTILNCTGVIITTNKKDSLFLPTDDRRHYVAWSDLTKDDFDEAYWNELWRWYETGGYGHVAAYLSELDLTSFNTKAPPPKTAVFWQIVETNRTPEDSELAYVLDRMGNPDAVTLAQVAEAAASPLHGLTSAFNGDFYSWFTDRRNRRAIPHRMEECGYVSIRNETRKDGLWSIGGAPQVIYVKCELSLRDMHLAANELVRGRR